MSQLWSYNVVPLAMMLNAQVARGPFRVIIAEFIGQCLWCPVVIFCGLVAANDRTAAFLRSVIFDNGYIFNGSAVALEDFCNEGV